jgi:hypothetical protein
VCSLPGLDKFSVSPEASPKVSPRRLHRTFVIELYMSVNGNSDIPAFGVPDKNFKFINSDLLDIPAGV